MELKIEFKNELFEYIVLFILLLFFKNNDIILV